jgi:hypothetical protein
VCNLWFLRIKTGQRISDDLKPLMKAVSATTGPTAECQRSFSATDRSSLNITTVAN